MRHRFRDRAGGRRRAGRAAPRRPPRSARPCAAPGRCAGGPGGGRPARRAARRARGPQDRRSRARSSSASARSPREARWSPATSCGRCACPTPTSSGSSNASSVELDAPRRALPRLAARCRACATATSSWSTTGSPPGSRPRPRSGALRAERPQRLVLAVPVSSPDTAQRLVPPADEVVSVLSTRDLVAVGAWYDDFTSDHRRRGPRPPRSRRRLTNGPRSG